MAESTAFWSRTSPSWTRSSSGWASSEAIERYPLRIPGEKLRFMFSRKTVAPELVAKVDATIEQMRADGRLDAITAPYLR